MSKFEVKKGIAIKSHMWSNHKYPFVKMDKGDCFDIPWKGNENERSSLYGCAKAQKVKITTRITVGEEGEKILRVWRIE